MRKVILFVTYTMAQPTVAGVFLRAVRVAAEMARRGWHPVLCNQGPWIGDPKVDAVRDVVEFRALNRTNDASLDEQRAYDEFRAIDPDVVVLGEGPFVVNQRYYDAAKRLDRPFVILDQYYKWWQIPPRPGVDLALHYALATFWDGIRLDPPNELMPPFIEEVTPRAALPVPAHLRDRPWITLVANDDGVRRRGLELLSRLDREEPAFIIVTRDPERVEHALPQDRVVLLPQQPDSVLFGLYASSAAALAANGFMQIMECVALACPIVALQRDYDVGTGSLEIAEQFQPFVSLREPAEQQLERLKQWLDASPFDDALRSRLATERHGLAYCATRIEEICRQPRRAQRMTGVAQPPWIRRAAGTLLVRFGQRIRG